MGKKVDRTGEININKQGLKMTIITYRTFGDIDIQFEDKTIVKNKNYGAFKKGLIKYPVTNRIGETRVNNQGLKMTIIAWRKSKDIDVQFEDGTIRENVQYDNFKIGNVPLKKRETFEYNDGLNHIEKHKQTIESDKDYEYIGSYQKKQSNNRKKTFVIVKHLYCGKITEINLSSWKLGHRPNCCCLFEKSIYYKNIKIARMIAIPENNLTLEDTKYIHEQSNKKFYFKCEECEEVSNKKKVLYSIVKQGYSCEYCSDGLSLPEKFMANILKQLNIDFQTQLNKSTFDWCKDYRYDFYIPKFNTIIETHGIQHYKERTKNSNWEKILEEEQANDRYKKHLAKKNNIKRYYSIDCRYSELDWLKENIIKTLGYLFDLSKVDWNKAWEQCQKSKCIEAWELWNDGKAIICIMEGLMINDRATIIRYLKIGNKCGKCNYTIEEARRRGNEYRYDKVA